MSTRTTLSVVASPVYPVAAMASGRATLKASARSEFGSRESRRLRRQGFVPGVVYANGEDARPFQVPERDARAVLSEGHALPKTNSAWYRTPASVAVAAHVITPAPLFLDRGKTRLDMENA